MVEPVQHQILVLVLLVGMAPFVIPVQQAILVALVTLVKKSLKSNICARILLHFFAAICSSACQNGGTCSAPDTCTCTANFTGSVCHTREFSMS